MIVSKTAGAVLQETSTILVLFSVAQREALNERLEHLYIQQLYGCSSYLQLEHL